MAELSMIFAKKKEIDPAAVSDTDKAVHAYVFSGNDNIQEEGRFPVYLALSELRRGLYNWYDFGSDARILEIGGGYGALTGLFCERAAEVTVTERSLYRAQIIQKRYENRNNLSIYAGDILDMTFEEKFDYLILTGILERAGMGSFDIDSYASYLQSLQQFLKPGGILLAAADNRYGLRYFAGMKNIHTGKVFDSIRKYPEGNRGAHSFTRREIDEIWEQAGFQTKKVYYPLPDYRLPQLIYTD
ncbi:MAG: class I SAM-dependent methyltransferase, partial [Lachnospiraceae bacterium]|nr:class I SAM-dependent methyltransferase [Lachnospiraceae bacterium]